MIVKAKDYIFTAYGKRWPGNRIVTNAVRPDGASSTTGGELVVAMAVALGSRAFSG
jgi:hypothetical protein